MSDVPLGFKEVTLEVETQGDWNLEAAYELLNQDNLKIWQLIFFEEWGKVLYSWSSGPGREKSGIAVGDTVSEQKGKETLIQLPLPDKGMWIILSSQDHSNLWVTAMNLSTAVERENEDDE